MLFDIIYNNNNYFTIQGIWWYFLNFNPLVPSARMDEILILKLEEIIKKISYERRDYESVDEKSLSYRLCHEIRRKRKNSGSKGLNQWPLSV